jgi:hypothetical protein
MKRTLIGATLAFVLAAVVASSAAPRPDSIASVSLKAVNGTTLTATLAAILVPHLGDNVTFDASFANNVKNPRIQVLCYQSGALVYGMAGPWDQEFLLGGSMSTWFLTNGDADCVATLYYWSYQGSQKFNFLAETQFAAKAR